MLISNLLDTKDLHGKCHDHGIILKGVGLQNYEKTRKKLKCVFLTERSWLKGYGHTIATLPGIEEMLFLHSADSSPVLIR